MGASLDRPALQGLLAAIRAGQIDIIVVYKVDRLTRSLADFAKLVELFDANSVSFVSVTQSFNTTSSMGRLTLNVLLSFAQFEREVIGERVRDKIAASKQKGLWVGGPIPLGYRSEKKQLVAVEEEAVLVRRIFHLYRDLGSVGAVVEALDSDRVRARQGSRFRVGALAHLLKNRFYLGEIIWRGEIHRGEHAPIVDATIFTEVQQRLTAAAILRKGRAANRAFILAGLLHDDAGNRMSPSHARKLRVRYRYYAVHSRRPKAYDQSTSELLPQLALSASPRRSRPRALTEYEREQSRLWGLQQIRSEPILRRRMWGLLELTQLLIAHMGDRLRK
jgi:site-specific DNA recombinase